MVMWRETILTLTLIATEIFAVKRENQSIAFVCIKLESSCVLVTNTAVTRHCTNIDLLIFSNEVYNTLSLKDIHFFNSLQRT